MQLRKSMQCQSISSMTANKILQMLCELFCKPETSHPFTILQHRSGQYLRSLLHAEYPNANIRIADKDYSAPTREEFEAWLKVDPTNKMVYQSDWWDCDDFARAIMCQIFAIGHEYKTSITAAYCEGYALGGYHAFNILIDNADKIWIVEPQSDSLTLCSESDYKPDFIQL